MDDHDDVNSVLTTETGMEVGWFDSNFWLEGTGTSGVNNVYHSYEDSAVKIALSAGIAMQPEIWQFHFETDQGDRINNAVVDIDISDSNYICLDLDPTVFTEVLENSDTITLKNLSLSIAMLLMLMVVPIWN